MPFRVSYANVASTLALVVALSGTSYAAVTIPRNSVGSPQVKNDSLTGADIEESRLGKVPNAAKLSGKTSGQVSFPDVVPSGVTLYGSWVIDDEGAGNGDYRTVVSYDVPFATPLTAELVTGDESTVSCPGTRIAPAAAPGYVCVYSQSMSGGSLLEAFNGDPVNTVYGMTIGLTDDGSAGDIYAYGSWAATAP